MPKRIPDSQGLADPVRARLAASAASMPAASQIALVQPETAGEEGQGGKRQGAPTSHAPKSATGERFTVNRKVMFTENEAERNAEAAAVISAAFGSQVNYSQISRALWSIVVASQDAIKAGSRRARRLEVPSKGDHLAMVEYEEALAEFLATAFKRS